MSFLKSFFRSQKYEFIDYTSLKNTVKELNAHIDDGMSCFVYFNILNGKTFTVEAPAGAVSIPSFNDKHLLSLGRYNRHNHVPGLHELADVVYHKVEDSPYATAILRKKAKL